MKTNLLSHWQSTLVGALAAGLISVSTIHDIASLTKFQIVCAFLGAALAAAFGVVSADAKQTPAILIEPPVQK